MHPVLRRAGGGHEGGDLIGVEVAVEGVDLLGVCIDVAERFLRETERALRVGEVVVQGVGPGQNGQLPCLAGA
jgi:hypothetical protein